MSVVSLARVLHCVLLKVESSMSEASASGEFFVQVKRSLLFSLMRSRTLVAKMYVLCKWESANKRVLKNDFLAPISANMRYKLAFDPIISLFSKSATKIGDPPPISVQVACGPNRLQAIFQIFSEISAIFPQRISCVQLSTESINFFSQYFKFSLTKNLKLSFLDISWPSSIPSSSALRETASACKKIDFFKPGSVKQICNLLFDTYLCGQFCSIADSFQRASKDFAITLSGKPPCLEISFAESFEPCNSFHFFIESNLIQIVSAFPLFTLPPGIGTSEQEISTFSKNLRSPNLILQQNLLKLCFISADFDHLKVLTTLRNSILFTKVTLIWLEIVLAMVGSEFVRSKATYICHGITHFSIEIASVRSKVSSLYFDSKTGEVFADSHVGVSSSLRNLTSKLNDGIIGLRSFATYLVSISGESMALKNIIEKNYPLVPTMIPIPIIAKTSDIVLNFSFSPDFQVKFHFLPVKPKITVESKSHKIYTTFQIIEFEGLPSRMIYPTFYKTLGSLKQLLFMIQIETYLEKSGFYVNRHQGSIQFRKGLIKIDLTVTNSGYWELKLQPPDDQTYIGKTMIVCCKQLTARIVNYIIELVERMDTFGHLLIKVRSAQIFRSGSQSMQSIGSSEIYSIFYSKMDCMVRIENHQIRFESGFQLTAIGSKVERYALSSQPQIRLSRGFPIYEEVYRFRSEFESILAIPLPQIIYFYDTFSGPDWCVCLPSNKFSFQVVFREKYSMNVQYVHLKTFMIVVSLRGENFLLSIPLSGLEKVSTSESHVINKVSRDDLPTLKESIENFFNSIDFFISYGCSLVKFDKDRAILRCSASTSLNATVTNYGISISCDQIPQIEQLCQMFGAFLPASLRMGFYGSIFAISGFSIQSSFQYICILSYFLGEKWRNRLNWPEFFSKVGIKPPVILQITNRMCKLEICFSEKNRELFIEVKDLLNKTAFAPPFGQITEWLDGVTLC